jgi:nucleoside diphosphate kinase
MERSLIFLKKDFSETEHIQEFLEILKKLNLKIENDFYFSWDLDDVKNFYCWGYLYNIEMLKDYWCEREHHVFFVKGKNAIKKAQQIKKFFRKKYAINCHEMYTLMHCPDSLNDYRREAAIIISKKVVR